MCAQGEGDDTKMDNFCTLGEVVVVVATVMLVEDVGNGEADR